MKWNEIPRSARYYILYHTIISPMLIVWYMLPVYLFMTGYTILEIGIIYTTVHIASIPLTILFGKLFEKISLRKGLVLIDALDGVAYALYGLAYGPIAPITLFLGMLIEKFSFMLYPLYPAVEKILYPQDRLEEVFVWHMRLPMISEIIGYTVLGYLFGYVFNTPFHYRIGFLCFAVSSVFTIIYLIKFLPPLNREERIESTGFVFRIDREFKYILFIEALTTLAWGLAPSIVFLNYVINVLGKTLFEAMLVEVSVSIGGLIATYITEKAGKKYAKKLMVIGFALIALWAFIMLLQPPIIIVILVYFIMKLGDTLVFPYYRSWLFSKIPKDKASTVFAALSSYDKVISLFTPFIASLLATIYPVLPYGVSFGLFILVALAIFTVYNR